MSTPSISRGSARVEDDAESSHSIGFRRSVANLSILQKLGVATNHVRLLLTALNAVFKSFLYNKDEKPPTLFRYVIYAVTKAMTEFQSPEQMHYISISTDAAYHKVCKQRNVAPESITLQDGTRAHWIGPSTAKNVLINFHGGGYVLPASEFMMEFMFKVQELIKADGKELAILFLAYDIAPGARYPRQLQQAAMLLEHVTQSLQKQPSNLFLSGDSAGGNLVLSLLSHLSHPHPDQTIPRIHLEEKLRGIILVSPWLDFDMSSAEREAGKDYIGPATGKKWSAAWLGTPWPHVKNSDYYNQATTAPASWWDDVQIQEALVMAGKDELLRPGIDKFTKRWQGQVESLSGKVEYLCAVGEAHDMPSLDLQLGFKEPGEQARAFRSWLSARL